MVRDCLRHNDSFPYQTCYRNSISFLIDTIAVAATEWNKKNILYKVVLLLFTMAMFGAAILVNAISGRGLQEETFLCFPMEGLQEVPQPRQVTACTGAMGSVLGTMLPQRKEGRKTMETSISVGTWSHSKD